MVTSIIYRTKNMSHFSEIEYEQPTNNVYPATIIDNNIPDDAEDVWENDDMFNDEEFIEQTQQLILGHTMTNDHSCKNSTVTRNSPEKLTNTSSVKEMYGKVVTVATAYRSPVENPATISSSNCVHNNAVLDDDMLTSQTQPLISDDDDMQQSTQIIANDHELSNVSCTKKNIIHSPNKRICLPSAVKDNVIINSSSKPTTATPPDISCLDSHLSEASLCDNLWESDDGFDDILCSIKCEEDGNSVDSIFSCATQIYSTLDTSRNDSCESETHPRCCNVNEEKNAACTNEICSSSRLTYDSYLCNRTGLKADEDSLKSLSVGAADKKYPCIEKVNDWLLKANTSQVNNMCSNTAVQTTQIKRLKRLQYSETERKGSVSMQSRCTVEEIERKRRQAIERRLKAMKERPL